MDEGRRKQQSWQWTFSELCMCLYGCVRGSFLPPGVPLLLPPPPAVLSAWARHLE